METTSLKKQWEELKKTSPKLRIRNAAEKLGVSEVELLATKVGDTVIRLRNEPKSILKDLKPLRKVMGLTRNDSCVHERKGIYKNHQISENGPFGMFVTKDIDLRIFFNHWASAFAVKEKVGDSVRRSIQFFSQEGMAIHKIFLTKDSIVEAYEDLVTKYKSDNQEPIENIIPFLEEPKKYRKDEEVDVASFHEAWKNMKDTHEFGSILLEHEISRKQALKHAPSDYYAREISKDSVTEMLTKASENQVPIMVFAGNRGLIQIHTGVINKTVWYDKWFNIMDPDFNLHLNMDDIASVWLVRKPTEDGIVTSIETFNDKEEIIVQFFGKRKPGLKELTEWQEILENLK